MKRIRRILHPSDFSSASTPAFRWALELAKANRSQLIVAHVLASIPPMVGDGFVAPTVYDNLDRSIRSEAQRRLDRLIARARKSGVRGRGLLLDGTPHVRIVRAARSVRAELIVMGTHGRGGIAKLLVGSVAERVIGTAHCPVLTVRGR
jgi:nucleotide-binding universal stress UspA family protein